MSSPEVEGGRTLDEVYTPCIFELESGNVEAAIIQRTEQFFAQVKKTIGLNELAQEAAEEAGEWHEYIDIIPLEFPGEKPMRMVHELWYYDAQSIASVVRDYRGNGSIAVSFIRHSVTSPEMKAAVREIDLVDKIITQESF